MNTAERAEALRLVSEIREMVRMERAPCPVRVVLPINPALNELERLIKTEPLARVAQETVNPGENLRRFIEGEAGGL